MHITDNRIEHHTDEYEHEGLIVRRGQQFTLTINLNRAYNDREDTVVLQFVTGEIFAGFPPIWEFRENFEHFFQSGKSGKNRGFSAKIREKIFKSGNFFSKPFSTL